MQLTKHIQASFNLAWLLLLLIGCSNNNIYEKIYAKPQHPLACLDIQTNDEILRLQLLKNPLIHKLYKRECPFTLKPTTHYISTCTSAQSKALGSDFDGFLRFELYENGKLLYRNQEDFKGFITPSLISHLIDQMKDSIGLQDSKK